MKWLIIILPLVCLEAMGQDLIPIGTWRSHFSFRNAQLLTEANNRIYAATDNAFMYVDLDDNSINRITRTDGLSDINISALGYSMETDWLVIGYTSGNIDLYNDTQIVNLSQITSAQLTGSRRINSIATVSETAYLATDFGVIVLDLSSFEIRESYLNLGPSGERAGINDLIVFNDSLFLATDAGIISARPDVTVNLLDFRNWKRINSVLPIATQEVDFLTTINDQVVAGIKDQGLFSRSDFEWSELADFSSEIRRLNASSSELLVSLENELVAVNPLDGVSEVIGYAENEQPSDVIVENGNIWIADQLSGLYTGVPGNFQQLALEGPGSNAINKLHYFDGSLYVLHENADESSGFEGYSRFEGGRWSAISTAALPFRSPTGIRGSGETGIQLVSAVDGLLDVESQAITQAGSAGSTFVASQNGETVLTGVDFDSQGNMWVSNFESPSAYHRRSPDGTWQAFNFFPSPSRFPISLDINELDDVWSILDPAAGGGIFVFNDGTSESRLLGTSESAGNLPSSVITAIAFDREGQVWIGSDQGIAFIPDLNNLFTENSVGAVRPIFENRFLLEEEVITAIAVDGGNRKWVGTNDGIWLFDPSGEELVSNFTFDNSPLPSNEIVAIEVDPVTGEVFIATRGGLVSIRGTSTRATEKHENVKIFPNPVRPGFAGEIGISGLAEDAVVKITDMGGRLVKEINANGGTAVWDGRSFRGQRADSGIYLVLSASPDGDETFVGKIAIVR